MSSARRECGFMGWTAVNTARETTTSDTSGFWQTHKPEGLCWGLGRALKRKGSPRVSRGFRRITVELREGWTAKVSTSMNLTQREVEGKGQIWRTMWRGELHNVITNWRWDRRKGSQVTPWFLSQLTWKDSDQKEFETGKRKIVMGVIVDVSDFGPVLWDIGISVGDVQLGITVWSLRSSGSYLLILHSVGEWGWLVPRLITGSFLAQ